LELGARGHLHAVSGGDLDGLAGGRVTAGTGGAVGALDGEEAGDGDLLVALGDDVAGEVYESRQDGVGILAGHRGALPDGADQLRTVHGEALRTLRSSRSRSGARQARPLMLAPGSERAFEVGRLPFMT